MTPTPPASKTHSRQYLSADFNASDKLRAQSYFDDLKSRQTKTEADLEKWILDWEELGSAISENYSRIQVAVTVDTTDAKAQKQFEQLVVEILPLSEKENFELSKKLVANPLTKKLPAFYKNFLRAIEADISLYREENLNLKTEERKLVNEFEKIMGNLMVNFRGEEMTLQKVSQFLEEPDEKTRKEAYECRARAREKIAPQLDELYARMLEVRHKIAVNAGFTNFRDYQFKAWHRFDYTPADCQDFHSAIAKAVVPLVSELHSAKKKKLGKTQLKPWDLQVDANASAPIRPFKNIQELVAGCQKIFHSVDAELGSFFDVMIERKLLDLDSRKGKAPGGYCTQFSEERVPFIFMNAVGTKTDVDTLLHEGGHSFHYFLSRDIKLPSYHHTGLEFAEVASMAMELLSRPHFGEFYKGDDKNRVHFDQLKKILEFFPFMAMIDGFQHWVYTSLEKNPSKWREKWAELEKQFRPSIDWSGFESVRDIGWQYPHVFSVPFYYVEYGIAQLGALSLWKTSLTDYPKAIQMYKEGLRLGASKTLPELFRTVGAEFGMNSKIMQPLIDVIQSQLTH